MARYAQIHTATGFVVNVVEWSGDEADWMPPAGYTMVEDVNSEAGPGYTYEDGKFAPPPGGQVFAE